MELTTILTTLGSAAVLGLFGWMFRIDRLVTRIDQKLGTVKEEHDEHCRSDEVMHGRIWQAHETDVGNLAAVDKRVAVVESHVLFTGRRGGHGSADATA